MRRTMTRYQISFAVAILAMSASLAGQSEPPKVSVVTFEFVASIGGEPLSGRFVLDSSNGRIHDGKVTGELTLSLPYGKYLALYQDNFFAPISREVIVDRPRSVIRAFRTSQELYRDRYAAERSFRHQRQGPACKAVCAGNIVMGQACWGIFDLLRRTKNWSKRFRSFRCNR